MMLMMNPMKSADYHFVNYWGQLEDLPDWQEWNGYFVCYYPGKHWKYWNYRMRIHFSDVAIEIPALHGEVETVRGNQIRRIEDIPSGGQGYTIEDITVFDLYEVFQEHYWKMKRGVWENFAKERGRGYV